jgi:hypothetical protein
MVCPRGREVSRTKEQRGPRTWLQLLAKGLADVQGRGLIQSKVVFTHAQELQQWGQSQDL